MHRFGVSSVVVASVVWAFAAAPAQAGSFTFDSGTNTYTYVGDTFNFCGYGCPEHAPSDPLGVDYLVATLVYGGKLDPNLTDATPVPISWTLTDFFGEVAFGGLGAPNGFPGDSEDVPVPGLVLSTNGTGDIVSWIMTASVGSVVDGRWHGTSAGIFNPGLFCGAECGDVSLTDIVAVRERSDPDTEWDAFVGVPAQTPEPGTLTLLGAGLLAMARRRLSSRCSRQTPQNRS